MAAEAETPIKKVNYKCFVCLSTAKSTSFNLHGRKCSTVNFKEKVRDLMGAGHANLYEDLVAPSSASSRVLTAPVHVSTCLQISRGKFLARDWFTVGCI